MLKLRTVTSELLGSAIVLAAVGCNSSTTAPLEDPPAVTQGESRHGPESTSSSAADDHSHQANHEDSSQSAGENHAGHDHHAPPQVGGEGLAQLNEADRALAEKQRVCPVSDELLGTMGKPIKLEVKGQTVFLCCPECEDEMKQNHEKYLAKLKTQATQ